MRTATNEILLSRPHQSGSEAFYVKAALDSNWLAPMGPQLDAFELEFAQTIGVRHAVGVSSGTAALHLALRLVGVGPGDDVLVSTLTFIASASAAVFLGAQPVFVDSEPACWNLDPALLAEELEARVARGRPPKAVVVVHLFGQSAALSSIVDTCARHDIPLIEDAAEALGTTYAGRPVGTFGRLGIFSFNGNKMITTSGGGMLIGDDGALAQRARWLAAQAKDPAPHYEHSELGYNYGLSNVLAAIGRAQLSTLHDRVTARRRNARWYRASLEDLPGLEVQAEAPRTRHARWLTSLTIDPSKAGLDREDVRLALARERIEARPVWKPLHLQPVFTGCEAVGGDVAEDIFNRGLCLPSGSDLSMDDLERVTSTIRRAFQRAAPRRFVSVRWTPIREGSEAACHPVGALSQEAV
jgi:pyridoxal phosphate-dependent aminotransferase EpsN